MLYKSYVYSPYHRSFLDCRRFYKDKYSCLKRLSSRGYDNRLMMFHVFDEDRITITDTRYYRIDKETGKIIWLTEDQVFLIQLNFAHTFPLNYARSFKKGVTHNASCE